MAGKRTNRGRKKARRGAAPPRKQTELRAEDVAAEGIRLMRPGFEFPGRVATPDDESRMRHAYMVFEEGWRRRTDRSARAGLDALRGAGSLSDGPIEVPAAYIEGDAAGVREFGDGKLRIMLSLPRGLDEEGRGVVVDDHLWLDPAKLCGCVKGRAEIRYGDIVRLGGCVGPYAGRDGSRRLGVGNWWLIDSEFPYVDSKKRKQRRVSRVFGDDSLLLRADFDVRADGGMMLSDCEVAEPERLDAYLAEMAERWKDAGLSHFVLD